MFIGTCSSETPLCSSEEMTQTFNGDVVEYDISIDRQTLKDLSIKQKSNHTAYIKMLDKITTK